MRSKLLNLANGAVFEMKMELVFIYLVFQRKIFTIYCWKATIFVLTGKVTLKCVFDRDLEPKRLKNTALDPLPNC